MMNEKEIKETPITEEPIKKVTNENEGFSIKEKTLVFDEAHQCASAKDEIGPGTKINVTKIVNGFKKISYTKSGRKVEGYIYE